jgi:GGDEF domain-containing protein
VSLYGPWIYLDSCGDFHLLIIRALGNRIQISITTSIGLVASASNNIANCQDMVEKADAALYAAKQNGRNCVLPA